jgi:hypothetical protein
MLYFMIGVGFAAVIFTSIMWVGLPWFVLGLVKRSEKDPAQPMSVFSLNSLPAIMESRTVYEFIQSLKNEDKRGAYDAIMSTMRKLLMDIKKHRTAYPTEITELKAFALTQLRFNIEHSPVCKSLETSRFRELAQHFVQVQIMQDIYMTDCKDSRTALHHKVQ